MTMMMMSLSRSGIESTQQKRRDVEKPSRVIWRIKKATTTTSKEEEEERIITRDDFDARVFTKICIMSLVLCACVLERERETRENVPHFVSFRSLQKQVIFSPNSSEEEEEG